MALTSQKTPLLSLPGLLLACGLVLVVVIHVISYFPVRLGHDQTSYLFEAQRLLAGNAAYGPHLSETNPPLIIWFSVLPVQLAQWLHGSPVFFLKLIVTLMIFGSVAWCVRILRRSNSITNPLAIGLVGCAVLAIEYGIYPSDFAQREHLLFILLVPYLLAAATGAVSRLSVAERCALGLAAGLAIWFKPQETLALVALELLLAVRSRSLRRIYAPEFLSLVFTSSFVLLLVRIFTPLYIKDIYPILLDTYWALGTHTTLALALTTKSFLLITLVMLGACFLLRRFLRDAPTTVALVLCSIASSVAYDVQHTQWKYHSYPHKSLLALALAYLLVDLLSPFIDRLTATEQMVRRMVYAGCAGVLGLLCVLAIHPVQRIGGPWPTQTLDLDPYFAQLKPGTTVYVYSTSVSPLSSAYQLGMNWGSRFAHLWMLPAIIQNELGPNGPPAPFKQLSSEREMQLAKILRTDCAEDLNYWKPTVVLVEQCNLKHDCQGIEGKTFDMMAWFQRSPEFAATWAHYQKQESFGDFDVYTLAP
jgi:hypothetical protein